MAPRSPTNSEGATSGTGGRTTPTKRRTNSLLSMMRGSGGSKDAAEQGSKSAWGGRGSAESPVKPRQEASVTPTKQRRPSFKGLVSLFSSPSLRPSSPSPADGAAEDRSLRAETQILMRELSATSSFDDEDEVDLLDAEVHSGGTVQDGEEVQEDYSPLFEPSAKDQPEHRDPIVSPSAPGPISGSMKKHSSLTTNSGPRGDSRAKALPAIKSLLEVPSAAAGELPPDHRSHWKSQELGIEVGEEDIDEEVRRATITIAAAKRLSTMWNEVMHHDEETRSDASSTAPSHHEEQHSRRVVEI